ncbi:MAG TPA: SNF2-related protein, partial [Blastocatellia bacterium]
DTKERMTSQHKLNSKKPVTAVKAHKAKRVTEGEQRPVSADKDNSERLAANKSAAGGALAPASGAADDGFPALPKISAQIAVSLTLPAAADLHAQVQPEESRDWLKARLDLARMSLFEGFGDLLCLTHLRDVDTYWYQIETARKVLKQFRGRVLLADEVGLGKTIEAGMVMKEYMLRGMAERILVLTPAPLVGQWNQELGAKFDIQFATTYDSLLRDDPAAFWAQPRMIASLASARRQEHAQTLGQQVYDLVVVDEAHHLKNRNTANWKLVDSLKKRFLLLLSATPVQNNLVELYNLLTLLKPGIFNTEKEFRGLYMTAGKPRTPANRDSMRDLMRDVMIRNTRSQVDVMLPPRTAATFKLDPLQEEAGCYHELCDLVHEEHQQAKSSQRLALRHLLGTAGSSPAAAASAIKRYIKSGRARTEWLQLYDRYDSIGGGCKEAALVDLLRRNPGEKTIVFVHYLETLWRIERLLKTTGIDCECFHGSMTGPEKDLAIERFRSSASVLLSTESGGEGRNLQFSNTMVNFDLPWNPMSIEQRIGRLHRIGQTRPVFIFNLAVKNTLEEYLLRVLDEKINMFELVVGEIGSILGEMDEDADFPDIVFNAWVESGKDSREAAFEALGQRIAEAKRQYVEVRQLDDHLFADDFIAG